MTRADLEQPGPPIRLSVLAGILGMSKEKLKDDAKRGEFKVIRIRCGSMEYRHVDRAEALRYLDAIGFEWGDASRGTPMGTAVTSRT
jgi:hypothetical protein